MAGRQRRVSVGFQGGQVLALRVSEEQLKALIDALPGGGWQEVSSEEGPVHVFLGKVVYVRCDDDDARVGFGA